MSWLSVTQALAGVMYKDWKLVPGEGDGRPYFQWVFQGRCVKSGEICEQKSRKWYLSQHMTTSEVVNTAFKAALTAEEHECRENFMWHNKRVFNPHVDVCALYSVCEQEDVRDLPA